MPDNRISDSDKAAITRSRKHAHAVRLGRIIDRIVKHTDPTPQVKAARTRTEKSLTVWMMHHGGEAFDQPFAPDHKRVIAKIEHAINHGGLFALAMPRGQGKTTILKWATLYCLLTGRRSFVVVIAATAEAAQAIIDFARQQIQESDTLHEHYPHVTTYARKTQGKAIIANQQLRADGKSSGIKWSKKTLVLPEVIGENGKGYLSNGAILEGHGLTGHIRGQWSDTKSGKTLRPDFVLLDDPQSRESAESESQCNMRERIITGDVLGLAGPRKKIAAVMPCTIVRDGDLAGRFLDHDKHPEWSGETCRMVDKWPKEQDGLWAEYTILYRSGIADGRGPKEANTFYRSNRKAMDAGSKVSWKERVRDGELSAIQTAENLLIETGDQFYAEYQNKPLRKQFSVYTITPELIQSRADPMREMHTVPESWAMGASVTVAATDINHYGLHAAHVAFEREQTAAVIWYGNDDRITVPQNTPEQQRKQIITKMLENHAGAIVDLRPVPAMWIIDGGYEHEMVQRFVQGNPKSRIPGCTTMVARGYSGLYYKPYKSRIAGKTVIDGGEIRAHLTKWPMGKGIAWNSHYWHEISQRAWLGAIGTPGSCSLPKGSHSDFATQMCCDMLSEKLESKGGTIWIYHKEPGRNDYGDVAAMCYMGAAWAGGVGTGGMIKAASSRKKYTQADLRR